MQPRKHKHKAIQQENEARSGVALTGGGVVCVVSVGGVWVKLSSIPLPRDETVMVVKPFVLPS